MGQADFGIERGRRDAACRRGSISSAARPTMPGSARACVNWIEFGSIALLFSNLPPVSVKNAVLEVHNGTLLCNPSQGHDGAFEHSRRPSSSSSAGVLAKVQALGVAIVAGRNFGAAPWIVGDCGGLVDVTDPDQMAQAMAGLLRDRVQRAALGERARQHMRDGSGVAAVTANYAMLSALARAGKAVT